MFNIRCIIQYGKGKTNIICFSNRTISHEKFATKKDVKVITDKTPKT